MMSLSGSPEYARLLGQRPISPLRELLKFPLGRSSHSLPALLVAFAEGPQWSRRHPIGSFKRKGEELKEDWMNYSGTTRYCFIRPTHAQLPFVTPPGLPRFTLGSPRSSTSPNIQSAKSRSGLSRGLPIGVQIVAPHGRDSLALASAEIIERATGGWLRPPLAEVA